MAVDFEELSVPSISGDLKGARAQRLFKVEQSDLFAFLAALYGDMFVAGDSQVLSGLATYPGQPWLTFDGFTTDPFHDRILANDADGIPTTDAGILVTVNYTSKPYDQDNSDPNNPGAYLSHSISGQFQILDHSLAAVKWETGDNNGVTKLPADIRAGIPLCLLTHRVTWHHVTKPPFAKFYGMAGKVNGSAFLGHQEQQVLFSSFDANREVVPGEIVKWELSLSLQARIVPGFPAVGWNHHLVPNPAAGLTWDRIVYDDEDADPLLPEADFGELFKL